MLTANEHILTGSWLQIVEVAISEDVSPVTYLLTMFIILPSSNEYIAYLTLAPVPRAQKNKTKRAAGSPAASTQLALCLRLAFDAESWQRTATLDNSIPQCRLCD
jgi:hypothetical protein